MNEFALKYKHNFKHRSCKFGKEDFVKQYLQLNSLFSDNKLHLSNLFTFLHPKNGS